MTRIWKYTGVGLLAISTAIGVPAAVSASTPPAPTSSAPAAADGSDALLRLEKACARVPNVQARVDKATALLQGDASTRGSIAWLTAQLQKAQDKGRTELVTVLQNRVTVRTSRLALLQERTTSLADIEAICVAHGFGG
jgi:hypothetical protein